jgi:hypothetical protein
MSPANEQLGLLALHPGGRLHLKSPGRMQLASQRTSGIGKESEGAARVPLSGQGIARACGAASLCAPPLTPSLGTAGHTIRCP